MDVVRKEVESLVLKELRSANEKFDMFHSMHEGYAVIKEEVEETEQDLSVVKIHLKDMWNNVKEDLGSVELAKDLKKRAVSMAVESIQVAAMAQKFVDSEKQRTEKENADKITG